jgi:hypothetical protein
MELGWKTVVSALAVLLAAGVFVQLGLGAQSPEPSIAAEATVGADDEAGTQAPVTDPRPERQRDDRDNRDDGRKDRDDGRNDRDDGRNDRDDADGADDAGVRPVNPHPQPVDDDDELGDDDGGGDDSDDGGGDD